MYEQALCKKEKEHQRNLKHQVTGKCKLTQLQDCNKNVEDTANVKCVENGDHLSQASSSKSKSSSGSKSSGSKSAKSTKSQQSGPKSNSKCFQQPAWRKHEPCKTNFKWQHAEYARDECGSGIRPLKMTFTPNRKMWCATPLSMYQSTIVYKLQRDVNAAPPCNVCEYSLPLCRGYYRKYDCVRPCEEELARRQNGHKVYRDRVQRYWEPSLLEEQKPEKSVRHYAQHNAYLG
ncbi:hypothetical protein V9T40_012929 [Parthenolecanium corni]|uniref:Uncharacterized protein n=1 Tax=Parthenolecanium corni TaxID=536013 RepID=A0AAN9T838_9HEMI